MKCSEQLAGRNHAVAFGFIVMVLTVFYALVLVAGLMTLPDPGKQIQDPWFTLMELLILAIAPSMVVFTVGAKRLAPRESQPEALLAVIFMSMCAAVTGVVHFLVLTLSHLPDFQNESWRSIVFGFQWPSVAYAIDILAWDVFFPMSAACTAISLGRVSEFRLEKWLMVVASLLAFAGLVGVPLSNMDVRNIGIIGYVVFYPTAAAMISFKIWSGGRGIAA